MDKGDIVNVMSVENDNITYIIDEEVSQAVSGTYLVDMDGLLSLNEIQRLPGKKLAISFNGSTIQVDELDVKVVGRVAVVMERKQRVNNYQASSLRHNVTTHKYF